ncbi:MAG: SPFH domain-containing protein [Anaerolineae bacterium]
MVNQPVMDDKPSFPLLQRLLLGLGRPLGLRWVGDYQLGVVYKMGRYHDLRGPGFFWINPLTDTMKTEVSFKPDFISTPYDNLRTRDALQLGLRLALAYAFDPRLVSPEQAAIFVTWPRQIRRLIVTDQARSALQAIVSQFYAEEICRGEAFEPIGEKVKAQLVGRLQTLAMKPVFVIALEVMVPQALQHTFDAVVKRAVYAQDLSVYERFELDQVQRQELYETLRELPGGVRYLNLAPKAADLPGDVAGGPSPGRLVEGTARSRLDSPPAPDDEPPPKDPPRRSRL